MLYLTTLWQITTGRCYRTTNFLPALISYYCNPHHINKSHSFWTRHHRTQVNYEVSYTVFCRSTFHLYYEFRTTLLLVLLWDTIIYVFWRLLLLYTISPLINKRPWRKRGLINIPWKGWVQNNRNWNFRLLEKLSTSKLMSYYIMMGNFGGWHSKQRHSKVNLLDNTLIVVEPY